eukprot:comp14216_c1_seq1/m.10192 comp14216_c1_seq1/g.10192  ORF comp14216_c1_seq1/g.10192 comp14216_c1_seq1/m.10192 type:complete len:292 (-) comp14216_c1_seq1:58-933(-)
MAGNFWVSSHCNHWLLDKHEVELTRHDMHKHGLTEKELDLMKMYVADMTQQVGHQLKLRQQIVATAVIYLRRFYSKNSYSSCDIALLVVTSLYLASKIEENGNMQVRNFIQPTLQMLKKEFGEIYNDYQITIDQAQIIEAEFYLLEELDCYTIVFHPYRDLVLYVDHAKFGKEILTDAWHILNDSYRTDMCLQYPPHVLALSAMYLATVANDSDGKLNHTKRAEAKTWFAELNVDLEQILVVCRIMFDMYRLWDEYSLSAVKAILKKIPRPVPQAKDTHGAHKNPHHNQRR